MFGNRYEVAPAGSDQWPQGPDGNDSASSYSNEYYTKNDGDVQVFGEARDGCRNSSDFIEELSRIQQVTDPTGRLSPTHLKTLRDSGLDDATIISADLVTVSADVAAEYLGFDPKSPCLVIPYMTLRGDEFYRFKPEKPLPCADGRPAKYLTRKSGGNRLYVPPILRHDMADILHNTDRDLLITEGEKKALKAVQEGFTAVALAGVWSWREKTAEGTGESQVIPEFDGFRWRDRTVHIAFDSDATENKSVRDAENALARELRSRGARVLVVRLPSPNGEKVGLDDFLVKEGAEALRLVLQESMPPVQSYFLKKAFKPALLAREMSRRERYLFAKDPETEGGRLYVYRQGVYRPAGGVEVEAQGFLGEEATPRRLSDTRAILRNMVVTDIKKLNVYGGLVNVKNGLLDPKTGELREHTPDFLSTIQIPTCWNPEAKSSELEGFLDSICGEWKTPISRLIGYLLVPRNVIKAFFVFFGDTDTGKTTLINLITGLIGQDLCSGESLQTLCDPSQRFAHANLEDKLLNVFDDMPAGYIADSSAIKVLTGGFPFLGVEQKYERRYYAPNLCRHIYACNELPRCADRTDAWYERMKIFPFEHRLPKETKDEGLRELFSKEKPLHEALLVRAVEGLKYIIENGWKLEGSHEAMKDYKARNDSVMAFLDERCEQGDNLKVKRTDFREAYGRWCDRTGAYKVTTAKEIYDRIRREQQFGEKVVDGYDYFTGLRLKEGE